MKRVVTAAVGVPALRGELTELPGVRRRAAWTVEAAGYGRHELGGGHTPVAGRGGGVSRRARGGAPEGATAAGHMTLAVRPEKISLLADLPGSEVPGWDRLDGALEEIVYVGTHTQYMLRLPGGQLLTVYRQNRAVGEREHRTGETLTVVFNPQSASLLAE